MIIVSVRNDRHYRKLGAGTTEETILEADVTFCDTVFHSHAIPLGFLIGETQVSPSQNLFTSSMPCPLHNQQFQITDRTSSTKRPITPFTSRQRKFQSFNGEHTWHKKEIRLLAIRRFMSYDPHSSWIVHQICKNIHRTQIDWL